MIFDRGILNLKVYMMIGLPTEEDADLDAMVELTERIRNRMVEIALCPTTLGREVSAFRSC